MSLEFTMGAGCVPAGNYFGEYAGAEPYSDDANTAKYGPAVLLKWRIIGGEHDGELATRICSAKLSPKSNLGKFAVALKGGAIATGERFSIDAYLGLRGQLLVEPTDSGGSRVAVFLREQGGGHGQVPPQPQPTQPIAPAVTPTQQPLLQPQTQQHVAPSLQPAVAQAPPTGPHQNQLPHQGQELGQPQQAVERV